MLNVSAHAIFSDAANVYVSRWRQLDFLCYGCVLVILSLGLVMVASSSMDFAHAQYNDAWFFIKKQIIFLGLGCALGLVILAIPIKIWNRFSGLLLIAGLFLLAAVLIPGIGKVVNGSRRWLSLGLFSIQASEVAKFCFVIYFASFLSRKNEELKTQWSGFIKITLIMLVIIFLLLMEPDFGTSVIISMVAGIVMFVAGVPIVRFALLAFSGIAGLAAIAVFSPYRWERLVAFMDPWSRQFDSGYQLVQSLIAFGRGEWFGVGLGNSLQKLFFLPEAHTDFIFAIYTEEFGYVGALVLIALFSFLLSRLLLLFNKACVKQQFFSAYLILGVAIMIAAQAFINMGVASGLLPTKGLTLPLVSYGGSSMLVTCCLMALVMRVNLELADDNDKLNKNKTVLIMAGGTGGHVYPGLAVAQELYQRGYAIAWLGSVGGMEKELVATQSAMLNTPIDYYDIAISGVRGKSKLTLLAAPVKVIKAIASAKKIISRISPCLVIGLGGFVAGPGAFAAWRLKLPVIIHEQNAVAGTTNKLTRLFAKKVLCAFPNVFDQAQVVGNPVRSDIENIEIPSTRMAERDGPIRILVLGGSRGAQFINTLVPAAIAKVGSAPALHIAHQSGKDKLAQTKENYKQHNIIADVVPFINEMADALEWADIAICRAGALTVSELAAAGVGAIFIPYPHAIGDHQTKNAEFMASNNAAFIYQQASLSPEIFAVQLNALLSNKEQIISMAVNAKEAHVPHCAKTFATICEGVIND